VIPNLKTLPITSGQEANVSNSSQAHENVGVAKDKKAFGDILNSQESHTKPSQSANSEKPQAKEGGNKYHNNGNRDGKELPSDSEAGDSSPTSSESTMAKRNGEEAAPTESTATSKPLSEGNNTGISAENEGTPTNQSQTLAGDNQLDLPGLLSTANQDVGNPSQPVSKPDTQANPTAIDDVIAKATGGAKDIAKNNPINSAIKEIPDVALNKEASAPTVTDDLAKVPGTARSVEQLLSHHIKQSESNRSDQKVTAGAFTDDGMSSNKSIVQPDLLASITSPVVSNTQSGSTSGVTNNVALANATKNDINLLQAGTLTPDDFAEIQQALAGGVTKEKALFESMENLSKLDTLATKPIASAQPTTSAQAPSVSALVNSSAPQILDPGVESALKSGALVSSVGDPGWDGEFAGRVNMLVKGGVQEAKIQLSPPEMGRLEIKVSTEGDSAKIMFAVESVAARDAIEQAMPRLREMLEQGGLQLSHSEVADHSQSQKGKEQVDEDMLNAGMSTEADEEGEDTDTWQLGISASNSTVDYYI